MILCSKGNKCNNIFKGGKLIKKINLFRYISFSTKLKTNFIKKVDLQSTLDTLNFKGLSKICRDFSSSR